MKRVIAVFCNILICFLALYSSGITKAEKAHPVDEVPLEIVEYAKKALDEQRQFMGADFGFVGEAFSSAESIAELKIGCGYLQPRLMGDGELVYKNENNNGTWYFTVTKPDDDIVAGFMVLRRNGELSYYGMDIAFGIGDAMRIMETLALKENIDSNPQIVVLSVSTPAIAQEFNGDICLITTNAYGVADEYRKVTTYRQLPTIKDYMNAFERNSAKNNDPNADGFPQSIELLPDLGIETSYEKNTTRVTCFFTAAAVLVISITVLYNVKKRKLQKN
ncbi:MAG: hypothetical protein IKZ82_09610 [Clostridia bacterium]|nr:hypothetical protein [Clostridia bacterium]